MFQVLIVDDEYLAQNKLSCIVDWEKYGFHIAETVDNGKDAVAFLNHNHIDVIFTDVCMPLMNGIELSEYVKNNFPDIKIVVLSSYNDYDYVRESFRNNALDYIMKHTIDKQTVIDLLKNISKELSKNNLSNSLNLNSLFKERQLRDNIISAIMGTASTSEFYKNSMIAVAKISNYALLKQIHSDNEFYVLYQNIANTLSQILKSLPNSFIFNNDSDYFVVFMPFPEDSEITIMKQLKNYIQQMNYSIKKFFDLRLLWGISCIATPTYSINDCYKEAINMLESTPIKEHDKVHEKLEFSSLSVKNEKTLLIAISTMNKDNIDAALDKIFEDIPINNLAINIVTGELIAIANKICEEHRINIENISNYLENFRSISMRDAYKEEFLYWCKDLFHRIIDVCMTKSSIFHKARYSSMVKSFIHDNYKSNITLKQISSKIGITESHLSTCFKEETGESISKYIISYRIEKAKELLEKDVDIKYLYSEVGFKNYNYFFTTFKKLVGMTPTQYRKNYIQNPK